MALRREKGPSAPEKTVRKELGIATVQTAIYRSGIPMANWGEVGNALITFKTGKTDLPPYQGVIYTTGTYKVVGQKGYHKPVKTERTDPPPPFMHAHIDTMLLRLQSQSREYPQAIETDTTTGTTIVVTQLPEENGLLLELNKGFGDERKKEEDRLAKLLDKKRGYSRGDVYVVLKPDNGQFSVDFDAVAERLSTILPQQKDRAERLKILKKKKSLGEKIAEHFTAVDRQGRPFVRPVEPGQDLHKPFVVGAIDGLEVSLSLAMVGESNSDGVENRWEANGAVLTGPLLEDSKNQDYVYPPVLIISVHRPTREEGQKTVLIPTVDPQSKERIKDITARIKHSFELDTIIKKDHE
jgi:hypothetical protein